MIKAYLFGITHTKFQFISGTAFALVDQRQGLRGSRSISKEGNTSGSVRMDSTKAVAHFTDGRIKKGYTRDFSPNKRVLHLMKDPFGETAEPEPVNLPDLKAVFFVKTFAGNPRFEERKQFGHVDRLRGEAVEVIFMDGEVLQGSVPDYNMEEIGFFFFPVDPDSNNLTLFVVNAAVKKFRHLRFRSVPTPRKNTYRCLPPENVGNLLMLSGEQRTLLQLLLPIIMEAHSARQYIVENLGAAYLKVGEDLLQEMEGI